MTVIPAELTPAQQPDTTYNARDLFGVDFPTPVPGFKLANGWVPKRDDAYQFDPVTTEAILAALVFNRRLLIQGFHGTGKSSHIEQIAARLNWPCVRINLDSHVSRIDLLGKDAIVLQEGKQVTTFQEGLLPWAYQRPVILVLDEYDAGRPDVLFVIQRILESEGRLTLLEKNLVLEPHAHFRLLATANTVGLGDASGMYHGTHPLNQGQLDRWQLIATLNYLSPEQETAIILKKLPQLDELTARRMVELANLTRTGFMGGDISTLMSPRTVLTWGENFRIFGDLARSFQLTFLNRSDELERTIIAEYYQRCFAEELAIAA